jgi:hypothetical protein
MYIPIAYIVVTYLFASVLYVDVELKRKILEVETGILRTCECNKHKMLRKTTRFLSSASKKKETYLERAVMRCACMTFHHDGSSSIYIRLVLPLV